MLRLIEDDTTLRKRPAARVRPRLIAEFGDGKWHHLDTITARLQVVALAEAAG